MAKWMGIFTRTEIVAWFYLLGIIVLCNGCSVRPRPEAVVAPESIDWLEHLPLDGEGRVFIGYPDEVAAAAKASGFYQETAWREGNKVFLVSKSASFWILCLGIEESGEFRDALNMLYQSGARRFVVIRSLARLQVPELFLPDLSAASESASFFSVNHARSFDWQGLAPARKKVSVRDEIISVFQEFAQSHPVLETSLIAGKAIGPLLPKLAKVALSGSHAKNQAEVPTSFSQCSALGACLGERALAARGAKVTSGTVVGIGFPVVEQGIPASMKISLKDKPESDPQFFLPSEVAETKLGVCLPVLSGFCVGARAKLRRGGIILEGEIVGLFHNQAKLIFSSDQKMHLVDRAGLVLSAQDKARQVSVDDDARLADLLVEWTPSSAALAKSNPWEHCGNEKLFGHPLKIDSLGNLDPACLPDTLYSWGPRAAIQGLVRSNGLHTWKDLWMGDAGVYFAASPVSSFGYGSYDESGGYAMRVKLRKDIKFKFSYGQMDKPNCSRVPIEEARNTVFIHHWTFKKEPNEEFPFGQREAGLEYIICSRHVLASWSVGTKDFYDELVRDVRRFVGSWQPVSAPSYIRRAERDGSVHPALFDILTDKHPFSQAHLIRVLKNLYRSAEAGRGRVFVNPELPNQEALQREHFTSSRPAWFHFQE